MSSKSCGGDGPPQQGSHLRFYFFYSFQQVYKIGEHIGLRQDESERLQALREHRLRSSVTGVGCRAFNQTKDCLSYGLTLFCKASFLNARFGNCVRKCEVARLR